MTNFVGFAVCDTTRTVYPFESTYKSRDATKANIARVIESVSGIPENYLDISALECHTPRAGENTLEQAEFAARDAVIGDYGLETGYTLADTITIEPQEDHIGVALRDIATAAKCKIELVRSLFEAWQMQEQIIDDEIAAREFAAWYKSKREFAAW